MKAVVIGESSGASMDIVMAVYPRHKAVVDKYIAQGEVIGIGPFGDRGNMAIFKTRAAAEQFVTEDPFILEGLVYEGNQSTTLIALNPETVDTLVCEFGLGSNREICKKAWLNGVEMNNRYLEVKK